MKRKIIILFLILVLLIPSILACGGEDKESTKNTDTGTSTGTDTSVERYMSNYNLNGAKVSMLYWKDSRMQEFVAESADGTNVVNDAIYTRNIRVASDLNCELNMIATTGGYGGNHGDYYALVEIAGKTHSGEYDILACYSCAIAELSVKGKSVDLLGFNVFNGFTSDWWNDSLVTNATIQNKLLFCAGDISTQLLYMLECVWFNMPMLNSLGLESPYTKVENNTWTLDAMIELADGIYEDLDNNGKKNAADKFGLGLYSGCLESMFYGSGMVLFDVSGQKPVLTDDYIGEKCGDLIVKLVDVFKRTSFYVDTSTDPCRNMFGEGRSLFMIDSPFVVYHYLDNYDDCVYGIVPAPKWNVEQSRYYTAVRTTCTFYSIFAGSFNPGNAAVVMEYMGYQSYKLITPALFETTMKYQYAQDDTGSKMFDIIKESIIFDFGRSFNDLFAVSPMAAVYNKIIQGDVNWASYVARMKGTIAINVDNILANFNEYYGN